MTEINNSKVHKLKINQSKKIMTKTNNLTDHKPK